MRVAFVAFDSTELSIRLASALADHADVRLILPRDEAERHEYWLDPRVDYRPFDKPRLREPLKQTKAIRTVNALIREWQPDVIHMQKWHLWFYLGLPALRRYPLVISVHDPRPHVGDRGAANTPEPIIRFGYRRATRIIVHNAEMRRVAVDEVHLPPEIIDIVPLVERGDASLAADVEERGNEALFFGRLWEYKGLRYFIDAAPLVQQRVPDARFVIAGRGESFDRYREMMHDPSVFEVHNEFVTDEERAALVRRSSVVVLPYIEATQSGVIPVAYTHERPVIATTVGGLPEQVEDGVTGRLVPPEDTQALADAMADLLSDWDLRTRMGRNGRTMLAERWSAPVVAAQTMAVYRKAIDEKAVAT